MTHLYHGKTNIAHEEYKFFFEIPVIISHNRYQDSNSDKILKFIVEFEETSTYQGMLSKVLRKNELEYLQKFYRDAVSRNNYAKKSILDEMNKNTTGLHELKNKINKAHLLIILQPHIDSLSEEKTLELLNFLSDNKSYSSSPLWHVEDKIFWSYIKENKTNDFIDSTHARIALSYSDYLLVTDKNFRRNSQNIIKDMKLNVKIFGKDFLD